MAQPRKHIIELTDEEAKTLKSRLKSKNTNKTLRGRIEVLLLLDAKHSDPNYSYEVIGKKSGTSLSRVRTVVRLFSAGGLKEVLTLKRNPNSDTSKTKPDGRAEAKVLQIACGPAPEGRSRWTLRLLEERCGTCSVFGAIEPLTGKCRVNARERRTKTDLAHFLSEVADDYPEAKKIVLVWDNLNTHKLGLLYEAFEPARARELASRFEVHYTPKHGSWLNVAEILLNILTKQCLKRRIDSIEKVTEEINKWVAVRNAKPKKIDWQFRTSKARIKLKSLDPNINTLNQ